MSQATCELGWSQLIHAEIISVTSAMRKNSRWSGMSVSGLNMGGLGMSMGLRGRSSVTEIGYRNQESPLMSGFATLKSQLSDISKETGIDASVLLEPFLEVIRSGDTNGPITASALGSVEKFLTYGILNINSPNLPIAMSMLSSAATHCKFEASDSVSDEFVLLKILQVLRLALTCEVGRVLSDEALCEMMETGLSMCCQMRLSEMLRRSAEHTMIVMVQTMFERLKSLEEEPATWLPQDEGEGDNGSFQESQVRMAPPDPKLPRLPLSSEYVNLSQNNTNATTVSSKNEIVKELSLIDANDDLTKPDENWEEVRNEVNPDQGQDTEATELNDEAQNDDEKDLEPKPSGLPSIRELLRVLISLLNPHDHQHTDTMRLMALSILNVAFEVGGRTIGRFEPLRALAVDELCKHLFQLARTDNMLLLSLTLRVISTVFGTLRPYLKLQQELYLSFLIERLTPPTSSMRTLAFDAEFSNISANDSPLQSGTSTPSTNRERNLRASGETSIAIGEVRELLLESLGQFAREASFMVDLWVNYDCNIDCGDLFEEVVKFLSKNSFPEPTGYSVSNSHVVCLDALLMYVNFMVDRLQTEKSGNRNSNSGLAWDKMSATEYNSGLRPNTYPSASGLLQLKQQKQILREGAARFNENPKTGIEFLEAFVKLFDFEGKRIDEAMREMLETFRLPGEAQQIERIMETFAETYFASGPQEIATQDATFVLSYSVIMLNTDLHNPQVRRRMSIEDYMKNLRNVNNGQNFSPEYLNAIYDAIRKREIIMPEEHEGQLGFNYAWKELLRRAENAGPLIICDVPLYDKDMFTAAWKPTVAAISYAFSTAPNDTILQKAITGFHQCALLSAQYKLYDVFDYIIMSLSKMTGLLGAHYSNETANNPLVKAGNAEITVSDLSIQFGRNYKGQLAAVVLFAVANEHGNILREGWKYILEIIKNLFVNSLLPASMSQVEDFLAGTTTIPLKPKTAPQSKQERSRDNSLLSALSSYLLSPYSGNYESSRSDPTDEEIECSMCTVDCVSVCRLEELFADIRLLEQPSLEYLMRALKFIADGNTATDAKSGYPSSSPAPSPTASQAPLRGSSYDPAAVFFLELMINVTLQNRDRIQHLWPILFEHITDILKESQNNSILLVERTVVALLRLCIRLTHKDEMVSDILQTLELLGALPLDVVNSVGEQMMAGILNLIKSDAAYIRGKRPWKTVFTLLHATSTHPQASKYSFDAISSLVRENKNINSDNFNECVELLAEFASAASSALEQDLPHESHMRTPRTHRARKAVELLYILYNQIPKLLVESETPPREAWSTYWLPILTGLSQQCYNPCREVRQCAISFLQRSLLDPELVSHGVTEWIVIFDVVLFPLLDQLLKPEIFQADPSNMEETRIRASALICKIFLHYLSRLSEWGGLTSLWSQILDVMERYMATGNNESLREAVPESLKNMLLVMSTSGVFNPPGTTKVETKNVGGKAPVELWDITWTKIDKFLPKLKDELFPEVPTNAESSLKSSQTQLQSQPQNILDTQLVSIDVSETNDSNISIEKDDYLTSQEQSAPVKTQETVQIENI
ncbi:17032_t:CDS:10 [Dentiscutata erythropus]|uniref:17032_t:CDS:1 n=1 Tax=Dentiscutata erythropus TaxID=1348616 RepID=A0A9N9DXI4_9GLOM|nr:17032_t:CDS:10 [Dentiscutata erythropus]